MIQLFLDNKMFFIKLLIEHFYISFISILNAIVLGLILGIIISEYRKSSKIVLGFINFIYTIPSISLLGFLIPLSGIGDKTAIIVLTIYAFLPMVRNTYTGITNIDKKILEAAKGMGSSNFQILYKIKLPLAFPVIMSGIRNMTTMTIALAGIASFIGAGGLGVAIYRGITTNNSKMTIIGSLLIAILAIGSDLIFELIEKLSKPRAKFKYKRLVLSLILFLLILNTFIFKSFNINENVLNIATKPMTEQYILGEMLKEVIENETNLNVNLIQGVGGGTSNIEPAMESGEIDIYPEYTGTAWNVVLGKDGIYNESMFPKLEEDYENILNFSWKGMYGFNNTYGLAVRKDIGEKYNLKTYSDVAKISDKLVFGAEYDFFEREDGYKPLVDLYGFKFSKTMDMDIGLKYKAIKNKDIDIMNIFTTDGQLSDSDVIILEDDKNFYPSYMCGNVIRNSTLEEYPELINILQKFDNLISNEEIAKMNFEVEVNNKSPKEVAIEFLKNKKILN